MGFLARFIAAWKGELQPHRVVFDDSRITFTQANGKQDFLLWQELVEVGILTTSEGPAADDVYWVLMDMQKNGFAIPSESIGVKELLARLQELPGFDNEAVVQAMGCSNDAKFLCWNRSTHPDRTNES